MSIYIDAYCENCGAELNIYQEWEGSNFRVTPCKDCIDSLHTELSKTYLTMSKQCDELLTLQSKLNIAIEALEKIRQAGGGVILVDDLGHKWEQPEYERKIAQKALKKLEEE